MKNAYVFKKTSLVNFWNVSLREITRGLNKLPTSRTKMILVLCSIQIGRLTWQSDIPDTYSTMWGPRLIAKLVQITPVTMIYGTYNYV